ncbi:hypothetical protein [Kitasatospora sp. NPDC059571]|uniref:LppU/SCO3897 family protein n=1 Tax=Kitasatospora sp. NPDC059571 TaxID=3346871 RepID=UPI00368011A7
MSAPTPSFPFPVPSGAWSACRFCGAVPAVDVTVRGHQGIMVLMRFPRTEGPFCRTCGIAVHRRMTARSLWQGWWGVASLIINPVVLLLNLGALAKIRRLGPPGPGASGAIGTPLRPGRPLLLRVEILGLLLPALIVGGIVLDATTSVDYADVGDCIHTAGESMLPDVAVVDCAGPDAEYRVVARFESVEPDSCTGYPGSDLALGQQRGSTAYTLCLSRVRRS